MKKPCAFAQGYLELSREPSKASEWSGFGTCSGKGNCFNSWLAKARNEHSKLPHPQLNPSVMNRGRSCNGHQTNASALEYLSSAIDCNKLPLSAYGSIIYPTGRFYDSYRIARKSASQLHAKASIGGIGKMPGARLRSFRLGDRSELLVEHLLAAIAFTTRVPRQEDVGLDFVCSLITGVDDANLLGAGPSFSVQAKSSLEPVIYAKPYELEWIANQDNPLLLCIADRKCSAMDVYSTWNLLCGVEGGGWEGKRPASCIRLHPGKTGVNWMGVENHPDNSQDILLGKPIARITHEQIFDEASTQHIAQVIAEWLELDRENIVNHRAGLNWVVGPLTYETGMPLGPERGLSLYWHPQNLGDSAINLMRSATALWRVLHVNGFEQTAAQAPWSEVVVPLRELLRWARNVDPSLATFLEDLETK